MATPNTTTDRTEPAQAGSRAASGSAAAYDAWFAQAEMKYLRRSPYSIVWKLWGQMPIRALRIGWMACEAWHRLQCKSPNAKLTNRPSK